MPSLPLIVLADPWKSAAVVAAEDRFADMRRRRKRGEFRHRGGQEGQPEWKIKTEAQRGTYGEAAARQLLGYPPPERREDYGPYDCGPFDVKTRKSIGYGILMNDRQIDKATRAMVAIPFYFAFGLRGVISCVQLLSDELPEPNGFVSADIEQMVKAGNDVERLVNGKLLSVVLGLDEG